MPGGSSASGELRLDVLVNRSQQFLPVILLSTKGPVTAGVRRIPLGPGPAASGRALLVTAESFEDGVPDGLVEDTESVLTQVSVNVGHAEKAYAKLGR